MVMVCVTCFWIGINWKCAWWVFSVANIFDVWKMDTPGFPFLKYQYYTFYNVPSTKWECKLLSALVCVFFNICFPNALKCIQLEHFPLCHWHLVLAQIKTFYKVFMAECVRGKHGLCTDEGEKVALLLLDHFNARPSVNRGWLDLVCEKVLAWNKCNRWGWLYLVLHWHHQWIGSNMGSAVSHFNCGAQSQDCHKSRSFKKEMHLYIR